MMIKLCEWKGRPVRQDIVLDSEREYSTRRNESVCVVMGEGVKCVVYMVCIMYVCVCVCTQAYT